MANNVIEIVVKSTDQTGPGFKSASAEASKMSTAVKVAADKVKAAEATVKAATEETMASRKALTAEIQSSALKVQKAEKALADAINTSGKNSKEAKSAMADLVQERNKLESSSRKLKSSEDDLAAASKKLEGAQKELSESTDNIGREQDRTASRSDNLKKKFGEVATSAAGFIGAQVIASASQAFVGMISGSVEAASRLDESLNAVNVIFGNSASTVLSWGEKNAASFGLSKRAFNELATPLGAGLKNAGMSMSDVTKYTIDLTKRASDMSSVFGGSVTDAMEAIQSGLRGEADPLERFGVGLSAAAVDAHGLSMGLGKADKDLDKIKASSIRAELAQLKYNDAVKKHGAASVEAKTAQAGLIGAQSSLEKATKGSAIKLTDQEKMLARIDLLMKQTASTENDFIKTSDTLANSQKAGSAEIENLQAKIGAKLIPTVLKLRKAQYELVEVIDTKVMPVLDKFSAWAEKNPTIIKGAALVIGGVLVAAFTAWAAAATAAAAATFAATWPVIAIVAAVAALAAGLVYAYTHFEGFKKVADTFASILRENVWPIIKTVGEFLGTVLVAYLQFAALAFTYLAQGALTAFGFILHAAAVTFGWIPGIGDKLVAADEAFGTFKDSVNAKLESIQKDIVVSIDGESGGVDATIASVRNKLYNLTKHAVTIPIAAGTYGQGLGVYKATGGVVGTAATGGVRSNKVMVGEHGPEIVDLPTGSRVSSNPDTMRILNDLGKGLRTGIAGSEKTLVAAIDKLMEDVKHTGNKGAEKIITSYKKKLVEVAKRRDAADDELQKVLTDARKKYVDYVESTKAGVISGSGGAAQSTNFGAITGAMQKQVAAADEFAKILTQLKKAGLDKTSMEQLITAGPDKGLGAARAILGSGGGGVRQLAGLQASLVKSGTAVGTAGAETLYRQGITDAQNKLANNKVIDRLTADMDDIANAMIKALKKKIKGLATGGVVSSAATGGVRSNRVLVGEQGPELVDLPIGSRVSSHADSARMSSAGSGGMGLQIEWVGGNAGDEFMSWLRKNIRVRGGNVQSVLGV